MLKSKIFWFWSFPVLMSLLFFSVLTLQMISSTLVVVFLVPAIAVSLICLLIKNRNALLVFKCISLIGFEMLYLLALALSHPTASVWTVASTIAVTLGSLVTVLTITTFIYQYKNHDKIYNNTDNSQTNKENRNITQKKSLSSG